MQDASPFGFFVLPRTAAPLLIREVRGGPGLTPEQARIVELASLPAIPDAPR